MKYVTEIILVTLIVGCLTAMIVILTNLCKSNFTPRPLPLDSDAQPSQRPRQSTHTAAPASPGQRDTIYWLNSNSAPDFNWTLTPDIAKQGVIAPFNSLPDCSTWGGGLGDLKKNISSAQTKFSANNIPFEVWMRPRNLPVKAHPDGPQFTKFSSPADLIKQAGRALQEFQKCADLTELGVNVKGFVCAKEDNDISHDHSVNCDNLADAFKKGVILPNGDKALFGVLGSPNKMNNTDITMAGGELYECGPLETPTSKFCYFLPDKWDPKSNDPPLTCPDPTRGKKYGSEMARWLNSNADKILSNTTPTSTVFFGGVSAGCPLEHDQLQNASDAFRETANPDVLSNLNLGLWS